MSIKRIISYITLIMLILLLGCTNSNAATVGSFSVSPTSKELKVGDTAQITIALTNCEGQFTISSSDNSVAVVDKTSEWIEGSLTVTVTAKKQGNATISVVATSVADNQPEPEDVVGTKSVNITVTSANQNSENNNNKEQPKEEPKPVEPTFTEVNETVYAKSSTNIRASYSTSSESYGMLQQGESITRTGVGSNGWSKVTYNGKTAYIYSNNLTKTAPEEPKSTDKKLKTLEIQEGVLEPEFDPDVTRYSISVPNNVEKATINAIANDEKAKVEITGNEKLVSGANKVKITVTAEDGTTRIYNIEINKADQDPIKLNKLDIPGITLNPSFNPDTYKYNVEISTDSNITDFGIQTETNQEGATVEVIGNNNFQEGENVITILVTSEDGKLKTSYQIIVNKVAAAPETGIFSGEDGKTNIALIAIGVLILIAIIIIIVTVIKKKKEDDEYYGNSAGGFYKPSFDDEDLDTHGDAEKENFTGVYKNQIMSEDEMEPTAFEKTSKIKTTSLNNEDYIPELKEDSNMDNTQATRRFSTNYDYKPETPRKPRNSGGSKGKHF